MLDVDVIGARLAPGAPAPPEIERLVAIALASAGIEAGHCAVQFVDAGRMAKLNAEHRGKEGPTDVLSFPIDGEGDTGPAPAIGADARANGADVELGDIVICSEYTEDLREAIIHGALHLTGMDHETDDGEMLALQAELLSWE